MHNIAEINCNEMNDLISPIKVFAKDDEDVTVENPTSLQMIGKGRHGAVFTINEHACIKIYGEEDVCARELYALSLGQHTTLLPKVYCSGKNFIVMEIIKGIDLREYLQSQPLTKPISVNLIKLLSTFKEIGYERIDHHKRHIFVQEDGGLRVLDVGTTVWRNRVYPYPRKLLNSLGEDYKALFLEHVKEIDPGLYGEWQQYMEMEKLAASLHQAHFNHEKVNAKKLRQYTNNLLTNQSEWDLKIEDLVRKVHKEEWVKALLLRGMNPDEIKDMAGNITDELLFQQEANAALSEPTPEVNKTNAVASESKKGEKSQSKKEDENKIRVFTSSKKKKDKKKSKKKKK